MPRDRIDSCAGRIHPIGGHIHSIPHGMSLVRRTIDAIRDRMNSFADGMNLVRGTFNAMRDRMKALPEGMNLVRRTVNSIQSPDQPFHRALDVNPFRRRYSAKSRR
jgi:hypothetical protein